MGHRKAQVTTWARDWRLKWRADWLVRALFLWDLMLSPSRQCQGGADSSHTQLVSPPLGVHVKAFSTVPGTRRAMCWPCGGDHYSPSILCWLLAFGGGWERGLEHIMLITAASLQWLYAIFQKQLKAGQGLCLLFLAYSTIFLA